MQVLRWSKKERLGGWAFPTSCVEGQVEGNTGTEKKGDLGDAIR